jgi:hypothetical protein
VDIPLLPDWILNIVRRARWGPVDTSMHPPTFAHFLVPFDWIGFPAHEHADNKKKLMAESIKVTSYRKPLVVRQVSASWFELLSDPLELEALKSLGQDACECTVLQVDETDGRLWQIAELLNQPELKPLDWAELVMEWVRLVREKDAKLERPAGGVQPHDKGFSRTGRVIGVSRTDIQRAEKIVSICGAAKAEIRRVNLKVKQDLLKIARLPADEQVAAVQEVAAPKPAARANAAATPKAARAKAPNATATSPTKPAADAPADRSGEDAPVASPPTAPGDSPDGLDIPPPPQPDKAAATLRSLVSNWEAHCRSFYNDLPDAFCRLFISDTLGYIVTSASVRLRGRQGHGEADGADAAND